MTTPADQPAKPARLVTAEEWARHRQEALHGLPVLPEAGQENAAGAAIPDVLLPYQQELVAGVDANRVVVVEKSRRTGYTWGAGSAAVLTSAAEKKAGGMDTLYLGYNLDMAREFIDTCAMWARSFHQVCSEVEETMWLDGPDKEIKAFRISFASGYEILALTSKPRSLRGRQGFVILDEAAFHDDLAEVLKAAMALLIWGGKVLVLSTHDGDLNPFNLLVNDIRAGRKPYKLLRCDFDTALRQGLYQRICLATGATWSAEAEAEWRAGVIASYGEDADEELFCVPRFGKGAFLNAALIEARMVDGIPVVRWEQPASFAEWPEHLRKAEVRDFCERDLTPLLEQLDKRFVHVFGQDFGRVSDLSVMWPLMIGPTLRRVTPFVVELRGIPFEDQKAIAFYIIDRLPRRGGAAFDATGNGAYLAEVAMQRYGSGSVAQIKMSLEWYRENMPPMKAMFEDDQVAVPKDADILGDLRLIKSIDGVGQIPSARTTGADGAKRHGDAAIALCLAIHASRMMIREYGWTSGAAAPGADDGDRRDDGGWREVRATHGLKTRSGLW